MGGPLWEATLPLAESYTHTNPMSATCAAAGPATDSPWLAAKTCIPCRGGVPPLNGEEVAARFAQKNFSILFDIHILREQARVEVSPLEARPPHPSPSAVSLKAKLRIER